MTQVNTWVLNVMMALIMTEIGAFDYPADPDCIDISDDNESTAPACDDGADNDG